MSRNSEQTPRTGAQTLVDCLEREGVEVVFGYPGGAALPIFDALVGSGLEFVLVRHEQGATHMADGYARSTGKTGVVLVTSGPGATNTVTGIYTAMMDSVPLVVITGQVSTAMLGKDAFQEADVLGVTLPIVKHSYLVTDAEDLARTVREAFALARSGRPGPVLIDVPKDVAAGPCHTGWEEVALDLPRSRTLATAQKTAFQKAAELFRNAKRPLLLVGHGAVIAGAERELAAFVNKMQVPVTNTLLGKGAFPETDDLSLGMLGMHGTAYANKAVTRCDLICSVGSRWDDRIVGRYETFCKGAKKIHIDVDPAEMNKVVNPDVSLVGDAREMLTHLLLAATPGDTAAWLEELQGYKADYPLCADSEEPGLTARHVINRLFHLTQGDAIVTTDVGQHQMWTAQFYKVKSPRAWVTTGGAGTMGFGFPAALGAQVGNPGRLVVAVVGDGGFQMTLSELSTAVTQKLPVKILLIDNQYLGMVRQWQEMFFENRLSGVDLSGNPDFVKLAHAYGAKALVLEDPAQTDACLQEALAYHAGPCLIHVKVRKEENVYPMIPAGKTLEEMVLSPTLTARRES